MDTFTMKGMLETNVTTRAYFLNVYAADQLPRERIAQTPWLLVCNCCPIDLPGEHWIAMYGDEENGVDVFDSFGLDPRWYEGVLDFLSAQYPFPHFRHNNARLQSLESDACGHYCLYFAHHRSCGDAMFTIVNRLASVNDSLRDEYVKHRVVNVLY